MSEPSRTPHHEGPNSPSRDPQPDDERLLAQVKAVLSPMPVVERRHIAQILAATHDRRRTPWQRLAGRLRDALEWWRFTAPPLARGTSIAAAALTVGFLARGYVLRPDLGTDATSAARVAVSGAAAATTAATMPAAPTGAAVQPVNASADASARRVPVQFLLDVRHVPAATQVHIVGDFNDWNVSATPLTREQGVWTTTVPLTPGRHVYAFVVNGDTWLADPRAPQATDADFGRPGSVIIVQAP